MRIHVAQQLRQPVGTQASFDLHEDRLPLDAATAIHDLSGTVHILRTDRGLLVSLHATASVDETCSRCLADAPLPITIDFQEEYLPTTDPVTGTRLTPDEAGDSFLIGSNLVLDLTEAVRQYGLVAEPAKPLCRPDCAGLCPDCGANLNQNPCDCVPAANSRWRALSTLKTTWPSEGS